MTDLNLTGNITGYDSNKWILKKTRNGLYSLRSTDLRIRLMVVRGDNPLILKIAQLNGITREDLLIVKGGKEGKYLEVFGDTFLRIKGEELLQIPFKIQKRSWLGYEV